MCLKGIVLACKGDRCCPLTTRFRGCELLSSPKPSKITHSSIVALMIFTHFTAHPCPAAPCQSFTAPLQHHDRRMLLECHLTPLPPRWPPVHPGQRSHFHIFPLLKQECLPLLPRLNLISSLPPSNSPITLASFALPFFFPPLFKTKREREREKKRLSTSKKHRDEWLFRAWLLGKWGWLCLWNAEWERVCAFLDTCIWRGAHFRLIYELKG